ncbi:MAG: hypothetical protein HY568_00565 [Candidatus Latescibacteria bacterium]|nr:hypothetical protein [Candidatus Latescibacterota bacterium]
MRARAIPPGLLQLAPQVGAEGSELARGGVSAPDVMFYGHVSFDELAPGQVENPSAKPALLSPERYLLTLMIGASTQEKLRYAQTLLSHAVPTGDPAQVIDQSRRGASCCRVLGDPSRRDAGAADARVPEVSEQEIGPRPRAAGEARERITRFLRGSTRVSKALMC